MVGVASWRGVEQPGRKDVRQLCAAPVWLRTGEKEGRREVGRGTARPRGRELREVTEMEGVGVAERWARKTGVDSGTRSEGSIL